MRSLSPRAPSFRPAALLLACLALGATLLGCGKPAYVRGSDVAGLDDAAMGTGLDRRDIEKLLHENLKSFSSSGAVLSWGATRPTMAVYPIANETSEHIESSLEALLSDAETYLVNSGQVRVVSIDQQKRMIAEVERQHGGGFDPAHIADYNKQLGAAYYLTGKVYSVDERSDEARRVQYTMFLQLMSVSTSEVLWQNKATVTKAILRDGV
jgi:uncharacterized protein (TIGR02722 family)